MWTMIMCMGWTLYEYSSECYTTTKYLAIAADTASTAQASEQANKTNINWFQLYF